MLALALTYSDRRLHLDSEGQWSVAQPLLETPLPLSLPLPLPLGLLRLRLRLRLRLPSAICIMLMTTPVHTLTTSYTED